MANKEEKSTKTKTEVKTPAQQEEEKAKQELKEIKTEFSFIKQITPLEFFKQYVNYQEYDFLDLW
ncbi:Uncharacterised protein, partial [Mycoplasmoides gallisepticum]